MSSQPVLGVGRFAHVRGSTRDRVSRFNAGRIHSRHLCRRRSASRTGWPTILDHVVRCILKTARSEQPNSQIKLIRQYRTRLIADVVTGKLDVREAAVRLPETDPLAGDWDRADTIATESNLHSTENHIAREASA